MHAFFLVVILRYSTSQGPCTADVQGLMKWFAAPLQITLAAAFARAPHDFIPLPPTALA